MIELTDPEDAKIVTLARSTRARTGAVEGACVRDTDGRTYAAASVELDSLKLTAIEVAVAMAVSSSAQGLEAVAVLGDSPAPRDADLSVVRDFAGAGVTILVARPDGTVVDSLTS
jgi:cytidine deaminase